MPRTIHWDPPTTPFTLDHVAPLGVTRRALRTALAAGSIVRVVPGVYLNAAAWPEDPTPQHLLRALGHQMLRPAAIASHETAALAWGLSLADPTAASQAPVQFIAPMEPGRRSITGDGFAVAVRVLPSDHRVEHPSGLRVSTPARSAVDVASRLGLAEALITLDAAARLALVERVGMSGLRRGYASQRAREVACAGLNEAASVAATQFTRARLAAFVPLADPRRESALESLSFARFIDAGLPLPQLQVPIEIPGTMAYPDFLWPAAMVIGEADGIGKYDRPGALQEEKLRQEALEQLGFRVVRWTYQEMLLRPGQVIARICRALDARSGRADFATDLVV